MTKGAKSNEPKLLIVLVGLALVECGLAQRQQLQQQAQAAIADCNARFPQGVAQHAVERGQCLNSAMQIALPLFGTIRT